MSPSLVDIDQKDIPELNGAQEGPKQPELVTDMLIVGMGPAGASLACFLASHGMSSGDYREKRAL
jgi:alkyl hydroperoxide reductase subunit AhpF